MTRNHTRRRTVRVGDELWHAFLRLHGEGAASERLRTLIRQDVERAAPPADDRGRKENSEMNQTQKEGTRP